MWNALRRHRVLFFSIGLMMTGTGLQNTLIALRGAAEGFSQSEIGFIMASFFTPTALANRFKFSCCEAGTNATIAPCSPAVNSVLNTWPKGAFNWAAACAPKSS